MRHIPEIRIEEQATGKYANARIWIDGVEMEMVVSYKVEHVLHDLQKITLDMYAKVTIVQKETEG
jgi:hypothetical protein